MFPGGQSKATIKCTKNIWKKRLNLIIKIGCLRRKQDYATVLLVQVPKLCQRCLKCAWFSQDDEANASPLWIFNIRSEGVWVRRCLSAWWASVALVARPQYFSNRLWSHAVLPSISTAMTASTARPGYPPPHLLAASVITSSSLSDLGSHLAGKHATSTWTLV